MAPLKLVDRRERNEAKLIGLAKSILYLYATALSPFVRSLTRSAGESRSAAWCN